MRHRPAAHIAGEKLHIEYYRSKDLIFLPALSDAIGNVAPF